MYPDTVRDTRRHGGETPAKTHQSGGSCYCCCWTHGVDTASLRESLAVDKGRLSQPSFLTGFMEVRLRNTTYNVCRLCIKLVVFVGQVVYTVCTKLYMCLLVYEQP